MERCQSLIRGGTRRCGGHGEEHGDDGGNRIRENRREESRRTGEQVSRRRGMGERTYKGGARYANREFQIADFKFQIIEFRDQITDYRAQITVFRFQC